MDNKIRNGLLQYTMSTINRKCAVALSFIMLFLSPVFVANAQTTRNNVLSLSQSFDSRIERLPPNFMGHSFDEVFSPLWTRVSKIKKKSDFESAVQYESRVRSELEAVERGLMVKHSSEKTSLAFVVNPGMKFNAEEGHFSSEINFVTHPDFITYENYFPDKLVGWEVMYSEREKSQGKYLTRNLLGQVFEIKKINKFRKKIFIRSCQIKDGERSTFDIKAYDRRRELVGEINLRIPPEAAEKIDHNIRWLLISDKILLPYVANINYVSPPSLEYRDLTHATLIEWRIFLQIQSLWVFDKKTGEVLMKVEPCSVKSHSRVEGFDSPTSADVENYLF